jgi:hypothetical protein
MGRETVVLLAIAATIALAVVHLVRDAHRSGTPSVGRQLVFGLCCGLLGAVAAAVPYADVVPDDLERPLLVVSVAVAVAVAAAWSMLLWRSRPRARHVRRRWSRRRRATVRRLQAPVRGLMVVAALLVPLACSSGVGPGSPASDDAALEQMDGSVPPGARGSIAEALALAPLRCPDLQDPALAASKVVEAAAAVGLAPDDARWRRVGPALSAGIAGHHDREPCAGELVGWMWAATTPVPVLPPTTSASPTTTTTPPTTTTTPREDLVDATTAARAAPGMSLREVRDLFGSPGTTIPVGLGDPSDQVVVWTGCCLPFANVRVQVHDGTVIAVLTFNLTETRP